MSTENTPVESVEDDLDAFSDVFFGRKTETEEAATSEEAEDVESTDSDANENDSDTQPEDDTLEDEDEEPLDEPEPAPEPKKKTRFQERIDELTGKAREAERERDALKARLEKLEQSATPTPAPQKAVEVVGPTPEDTNEDGTEKYPLGEFDPGYIRDLTKHTLEVERQAMVERDEQARQEREMEEQKAALQSEWNEKLVPARERYPDFAEKGSELFDTFANIDERYGEYLTATIMSMEHGPDVLYYLSTHLDEAAKIVNSGATRATLALGRLEAKYALAEEEKQKARPKVSQAPEPPVHLNKGSAPVKPEVAADTDDLAAFEAVFFKKNKRRG